MKLLGDLTLATSNKVGLWRVGDTRVLTLGDPRNISKPSGILNFSNHKTAIGERTGDLTAFAEDFPNQKSSVLIGSSGERKENKNYET